MKRRMQNPCRWQLARLASFVRSEKDDTDFYEGYCEKTGQHIPFRILTVILFIQKDEYARKPGSLITLYRIANSGETGIHEYTRRYERYYDALKENGFL
jgi:hypothetical protein